MSFDDIVGTEGLSPEDGGAASPRAPAARRGRPAGRPRRLRARPSRPRRPIRPEIVRPCSAAAAAWLPCRARRVLAAFGGGYGFGHSKAKTFTLETVRTVPMHGSTAAARGVIRVGSQRLRRQLADDRRGSGLPKQASREAYYELWLTKGGKPTAPCGSFRVHGKTTRVRLSVPYASAGYDGWVVTPSRPEAARARRRSS